MLRILIQLLWHCDRYFKGNTLKYSSGYLVVPSERARQVVHLIELWLTNSNVNNNENNLLWHCDMYRMVFDGKILKPFIMVQLLTLKSTLTTSM